ncbi:hypothetical protein NLI96_g10288 [Meripilus lineatus]|uniref:Uncharacterized protein n=1 Tax=Meripilus lineatus TaxID=2056292 RepID=A0AAD5YC48_9APHY|nr:hypothetical protein NLI96_g10288 [Physisporinus lineatus]
MHPCSILEDLIAPDPDLGGHDTLGDFAMDVQRMIEEVDRYRRSTTSTNPRKCIRKPCERVKNSVPNIAKQDARVVGDRGELVSHTGVGLSPLRSPTTPTQVVGKDNLSRCGYSAPLQDVSHVLLPATQQPVL